MECVYLTAVIEKKFEGLVDFDRNNVEVHAAGMIDYFLEGGLNSGGLDSQNDLLQIEASVFLLDILSAQNDGVIEGLVAVFGGLAFSFELAGLVVLLIMSEHAGPRYFHLVTEFHLGGWNDLGRCLVRIL